MGTMPEVTRGGECGCASETVGIMDNVRLGQFLTSYWLSKLELQLTVSSYANSS